MKHHKTLDRASWQELSLVEQLGNIGSEVFRSLNWKEKENIQFAQRAFERSLELFELTQQTQQKLSILKEVSRAKEAWIDYFQGANEYDTTKEQWQRYFMQFTYLARNHR